MKQSNLVRIIDAAGSAGVPVLLWGQPGTGKTKLIEQVSRTTGAHMEVLVGSAAAAPCQKTAVRVRAAAANQRRSETGRVMSGVSFH